MRHAAAERRPPSGSGGKRLRYHRVLHEEDPHFEPAFALYSGTFPPEERTTREAFMKIMRRGRLGHLSPSSFHMIVALLKDRVVGMGTGRYLSSANIGYVAYLAVDPGHKGRRIGPGIRNHLISAFRHDAELTGSGLRAVIGEVEHTNRWLRILAGRGRVMALDIDYEQPRLGPHLTRVPLVLYYQPMGEMPEFLEAEDVARIVAALYREVYLMENPEERPVYRNFLERLRGRDRIGHRRIKR